MKRRLLLAAAGSAFMLAGSVNAQIATPPGSSAPVAVPELGGRFPVVMEMDPSLPDHTVYRPADLAGVGRSLPVVAYGAGACLNLGNWTPQFLGELASHGYIVVAGGPIVEGVTRERSRTEPSVSSEHTQNRTAQLLETIDWAIAQNDVPGSRYEGRVATDKIAVVGHSCGGLQAIAAADDPRVKTAIIGNSGVIRTPPNGSGTGPNYRPAGIGDLKRIHAPMLYVSGGPTDQATPNAVLDFAQIEGVAVFHGDIATGHGGTYREPRGGEYGVVMREWLDWQLLGDEGAKQTFAGPDCRLCADPRWTIQRKNFD